MKARVALFSLMFLFGVHASAAEPVDESCECKESTCGPCEIETGTTFYSAKCGADLSRVKSCKKARSATSSYFRSTVKSKKSV